MDVQTISLTLRLALLTTILLLVIALPLAWWITEAKSWVRGPVQAIVALPLVLPPTVLGFYLLLLLGPATVPGRLLIRLVGHPLAFTFTGLLLGSMIYSMPFVVQPLIAGFRSVAREQKEAAAGLGAGPWRVFCTITLPSSRGALLAGALLAFLHTVGEFGVVLMIGGNIPGSTRTISIALYDLVEDGRYTEANRTAFALVAVALAALLMLYGLAAVRSRSLLAD